MFSTRSFWFLGLVFFCVHTLWGSDLWAATPNFVIIFTDDQGYADVSAYGAKDIRTPHIDSLARDGMLFTSMRSNANVCSPSRAALLTGRYADRVGVPGLVRTIPENNWGFLAPGIPTLADELAKAGYYTGHVGKWNLGLESPNTPNERGFAFYHGFLGDMMDSYTTHLRHDQNYLRLNQEPIEAQGHATDLFTQWAIDFLTERATEKERPFFLYLAYNAPHFPIEPPADWLARVKERLPDIAPSQAEYIALVEHLDEGIGKVLATLKDLGLAENTLVAFASDNGGSLVRGASNAPWKGEKGNHYDGGLKVPFLVRWPAGIEAGTKSDYEGLSFDLFPTFLELAGVTPEDPAALDAVSLVPIFRGEEITEPRELYFVRREGGRNFGGLTSEALVRGDWKLLRNNPFSPYELYQIRRDPGETTNLAGKNRGIYAEMQDAIRLHIQRAGAVPWEAPMP